MSAPSARADRSSLPWAGAVPYAQSITVQGPLVFTAGQGAFDDAGELVPGDVASQTRLAFANLEAVLAAAGTGLDGVVSMTVFLARAEDFAAFKAVRAETFSAPLPALTTVRCDLLEPGMLVEVNAVAVVGAVREAGH